MSCFALNDSRQQMKNGWERKRHARREERELGKSRRLQVEEMEDQKIRCVVWSETEAEMRRRKRQEGKQENEGDEGKAVEVKWSFGP